MRPIDADDVIERLDMICDAGDCLSPVTKAIRSFCKGLINNQPTIEVEPVKHEQRIDHEKLIGIFGTLCDHMVDNGRCDVLCPYTKTKDENDECEAWRTIQKIRQGD